MSKDKKIYEEEIPVQETDIVEEPIVEETPEPVDEIPENVIGTVSSEVAYMRKDPVKSGAINLFLKKGDTVMITADGDVGNYYLVTAQTKVGYVLKNDITIK